jgi:hypothetical protein
MSSPIIHAFHPRIHLVVVAAHGVGRGRDGRRE